MESSLAFIPTDRRLAVARGVDLPDRATGAALFADISGFTGLTETLVRAYGPQRGAEELIHKLDSIYDALIGEVDRFSGSTIGFAGDAITCWFDEDDGLRALNAAAAMQRVLADLSEVLLPLGDTATISMKVAVARGQVRRFVVGDSDIQLIDTLAGEILNRIAAAEHLARPGEIVLDEQTATSLGDTVVLKSWRRDPQSGSRCAVVERVLAEAPSPPWWALATGVVSEELIRPWILKPTYERMRRGQGDFLAELRPATALFLSFDGIDFDEDPAAGAKLDAYVRWVQAVLARYEGFLIQLTLGDKGAYIYAAFGAPLAHDDDPRRAVAAAAELRFLPDELDFISTLRMAITAGLMRTGPYGGTTRRTYGAVGDAVNLAARLMQLAAPWQILATQVIARSTESAFLWQNLPPLRVPGKRGSVAVAAFAGPRPRQGIHLPEQTGMLPLIGRATELDLVRTQMRDALAGQGRIVGITGEPGCGKSRFLGEAMRLGQEYGFSVYGCGCESYGMNHSYLVWQSIWQAFFGLDLAMTPDGQIAALEEQLRAIDPALVSRLPLLGPVLGLRIPDNDLTRTFDARLRKTSLEALLVDCIRERATATPLLLVLEDCHWIDPVSHDLLEVLGRAIADRSVLMVLAYRPPEPPRLPAPRVSELPYFTALRLDDLSQAEAQRLIQLKMQQIAGADVAVSPDLAKRIVARAQGNPFFIEELLNYLRDLGVGPADLEAIERLDLPTSLQRLVLSRIDRLSENEQVTLKAASIIGRSFPFRWLWGVYPDLGDTDEVRSSVTALTGRELTVPEESEPNLTYAFKNPVTHEVSYASLLSATRATLHRQLGRFLEQQDADSLSQRLDLLAFHFDRSNDLAKKREYLRRAGEAAQDAYANESAIDYYRRLLPLVDGLERAEVTLLLGQVLDVVGNWTEASDRYRQALELAEQVGDRPLCARCRFAVGRLRRRRGRHEEALECLDQALDDFQQADDPAGASQILTEIGIVHRLRGEYARARTCYDRSLRLIEAAGDSTERLALRATTLKEAGTLATQQGNLELARHLYLDSLATLRDAGDKTGIANLLNNLGILARWQGDYQAAHASHSEALAIRRQVGDRWAISYSLTNLGIVAHNLGDLTSAQALHEEALTIQRQLGANQDIARSLHNLANVARDQHQYDRARSLYDEAFSLYRELGDQWDVAYLFEDLGILMAMQSRPERAACLVGVGAAVRQSMNTPLSEADSEQLRSRLAPFRSALGDAAWEQYSREGMNMSQEEAAKMAFT